MRSAQKNLLPEAAPLLDDPLQLSDAGPRAIRGGAIRVAGYVAGSALAAAASILLLRYLGVAGYGRYATVISLVGIVTGLTDVGLTLVGQREYVVQNDDHARQRLLGNMLGIRVALAPIAVGAAVLFSLVVGYGRTRVLGVLIMGGAVVGGDAVLTMLIPLAAQLRFVAVTVVEVSRQLITVLGNAALVIAGATLLAFFGVPGLAAAGAGVCAAVFAGRRVLSRPRFSLAAWGSILRESAPMGAAVIVSALYLRTLVVMASVLTTTFQTGLFAASYRVLETLAAIPALMVGSAFPIMSRAAEDDGSRLGDVTQQLLEASLVVVLPVVIFLSIGARPIVEILGGTSFGDAAHVLRLQAFALIGSFASVVWTTTLVAVRKQKAVLIVNGIALASVLVLGGILIPAFGAAGAAAAAVAGEGALALTALLMLVRSRPDMRPNFRFAARLVPALVLGWGCSLLPIPSLGRAALGVLVYSVLALALGAVPNSAVEAFRRWRAA